MPGKVKVKIISGRNLPVMDRSSDTTDAYVEIKLGSTTYKTDVCRKSLHPQWNSEWYRFEVDDSELQDEPLQIRLMDHDTYSANDAIGKVYLDLNPLLLPAASLLLKWNTEGLNAHETPSNSVMSGWIPVYDTMHGIRGEVNVTVKVELFSDFNKFRQSSCGVQFFCSPVIPHGYYAQIVHGFVEELVVNDDPEYQWIDKIRTPRASNEARQTLFFKLSGELQRKIGVKALDLGGNAVIGYNQCFDLEGESGIVARGIGTAVTLIKMIDVPNQINLESNTMEERAESYLKFLGSAKGFFLNSDSDLYIKEKVTHPLPSPAPSIKSLKLELIPEFSTHHLRHLSDKGSDPKIHHSASLQTLLKQEDNRGRPSYGISQKFKNLKYSSQNLLNKRITAKKAKKHEIDSDDTVDAKKRHAYKYRRTQSDSTGMAEILVRSISQATASLDCIVEIHDSPPKISIHEELNEASDLLNNESSNSYLSLPDTSITHSSNASSTSSDSLNLDDEDNLELDTISNIVEKVRKLSSNQAPLTDEDKLLFIIGDLDVDRSDDDFNASETIEPDNMSNVDTISLDAQSVLSSRLNTTHQSFFPLISKTFHFLRKSPTAHSLAEIEKPSGLGTKFTSLHNIYNACSKVNKYSLHGGKETVLGELFKRVSSEPNSPTIEEEVTLDDIIESVEKEKEMHGFLNMIKERKEKLMQGPKVLFHKLDSKIHKEEESYNKNQHGLLGTALGNVLIDSMNEILATTHSEDDTERIEEKSLEECYSIDCKDNEVDIDEASSVIANGEENINKKTFKQRLFKVPKALFQRLDLKIHKKVEIKDEGLLGTALGNVLMDSVNEILVTSHSNPDPPKTYNFVPDLTLKPVNTEIDTGNSDSINIMHACLTNLRNSDTPPTETRTEIGHQRTESIGTRMSHSPAKLNAIPCILRRSSDSDLSITPKGNSLTGSDRSGGCSSGQFMRNAIIRSTVPQENFDIMEYPFLTMSKYPMGFIAFIGGAVSARSVKLLERITNIEEPESRDTWWSEIRMEIRSHARALNCNAVLGYTETTSICDDVCVLSASGTAAVIGYQYTGEANDNICGLPIIPKANPKDMMTTSLDRNDFEKEKVIKVDYINNKSTTGSPEREPVVKQACTICHLPYLINSVPLRNSSSKCSICRTGKVPDVLIATIEIPDGIPSMGRGCFVQSYVCRHLRDLKGESNAKEISDGLPFLEYELHRLLINKLKVKGMNAVFGLKVRISIGERMLIGIATGTAVFLTPLPTPPLPKLVSDRTTDEKKLAQIQKSLHDTVKKNREIYQLRNIEEPNGKLQSDTDDSEDEQASLDLSVGNKDCCILEVDDPEDVDVLNSIMEPRPPDGFHVVNTELVPGLEELEIVKNLQMFTQIWRAKLQPPYSLDKHFHRLLQSVYFKLRRMIPCALCDLQFRVDSPEPDEIQLCVLGMALGLGDPQRKVKRKIMPKRNDDELIFNLEEDQIPEHSVVQTPPNTNYLQTQTLKHRQKSPIKNRFITRQRHVPYRERHGVDITPLSYVPGGKIEKYLGNLNFFFIRETTSIREEGGLSGFIHSFVTEILAIVRAHVTALGGNAMVAYFITECVLNHNLHKNQGQCLINVGGDVVYVTYYSEDH